MFYSKKFKRFKNINHCFFSREGGFSKGIYKGLNCGKGSKDSKKNVNKNLSLVSKKMKINQTDGQSQRKIFLFCQRFCRIMLFIMNKIFIFVDHFMLNLNHK